jgi:hypothetical protein
MIWIVTSSCHSSGLYGPTYCPSSVIVTIGRPVHASLGSTNGFVDDRKMKGGDFKIANQCQNSRVSTLHIWGRVVDHLSTWQPCSDVSSVREAVVLMAACPSVCMYRILLFVIGAAGVMARITTAFCGDQVPGLTTSPAAAGLISNTRRAYRVGVGPGGRLVGTL